MDVAKYSISLGERARTLCDVIERVLIHHALDDFRCSRDSNDVILLQRKLSKHVTRVE